MKNLKAISPVVATALLVLIAVAVSVLLYTWVSGTVSTQPTGSETVQARLIIDDVNYNSSTNTLTIYVRNVGSVPVNLSSIYVLNASTGNIIASNKSIAKVVVPPGNITTVLVKNVTLKPGDTIVVKVVSRDGVTATFVKTIRG